MRNFLFLIFSVLLISCANTVDTVSEEGLDGSYKVIAVQGDKPVSDSIIFNFETLGNRISGNAGCNQFSAHYNQQGNDLEFSTPMSTRKFCEGKMEIERKILSSFEDVARINYNGKEIIIFSESDEALLTLTKIDRSE
ncbi:META domain-containing protein [Salinimicrobium sp. HB62]|uniref:META domain-containing protein n=1 Tax=Salinimicrobium sp. HB62 TaxID=3077781 RepID=UPI002D7815C7|nr:META domain-containing protein [Salinimicrobium sp. HB62]